MSPVTPFFTVVTPTFNRAHTLERVRKSLLEQTFEDFDWVIVDDGSTDGTAELVRGWIDAGNLKISYLSQPNAGKHVAFNRAVRFARGRMVVPLDSDDACVPRALERFRLAWLSIPHGERDRFACVMCLCMDERGRVLGGPLPDQIIDGHPFQVMDQLRRTVEMWVAYRTDVLRAYPFPEYPGERFVPEGLVWNRIGRQYQARFFNEALRIYYESADSLSRSSVQIRASSPRATLEYYSEAIELPVRFALRLRAASNHWRFAIASSRRREPLLVWVSHPLLSTLALPLGVLMAIRDRSMRRAHATVGAVDPAN